MPDDLFFYTPIVVVKPIFKQRMNNIRIENKHYQCDQSVSKTDKCFVNTVIIWQAERLEDKHKQSDIDTSYNRRFPSAEVEWVGLVQVVFDHFFLSLILTEKCTVVFWAANLNKTPRSWMISYRFYMLIALISSFQYLMICFYHIAHIEIMEEKDLGHIVKVSDDTFA